MSISVEQYLAIANLLPDPVLLVTATGEILAANQALATALLLTTNDLVGKPFSEILAESSQQLKDYLSSCARSTEPVPGLLTFCCSGGATFQRWIEGLPFPSASEDTTSLIQIRFLPQGERSERVSELTSRIQKLSEEVTTRRQAELYSEEQRTWLQVTLSSIGDAVIATDNEGRIAFMNPVAETLTGWTETAALGRPCTDVFVITNEDTGAIVESPVEQVLRKGTVVGLANHTVLTARDGTRRPIDDSGAPIKDSQGNLKGVVLVFRDITERKREEKIQQFLLRLDDTIRPLNDPDDILWQTMRLLGEHMKVTRCTFGVVDVASETITVSRDYCSNVPSHVGTYPLNAFGPLLIADLKTGKTCAIADLKTDRRTSSLYADAYAPLDLRALLAVPLIKDGQFIAGISVHEATPRDWLPDEIRLVEQILERTWLVLENARLYRLARQQLFERREVEERLQAVMDNTPAIIYVKDRQGRYTLVNQAFETLNGHRPGEAVGKTDREIFPPEFRGIVLENDRKVWETGQSLLAEETGFFQGQWRTYLSTKFPLRDQAGEIYAVCGVSTDITRRKQEEAAQQFLTQASTILASSLDYRQTLQRVVDLAVPHISDWCAVDMLDDAGKIVLLAVAHVDPEKVKWAYELRKIYPPDPEEEQGLPNVLRTGKSEIYPYIPQEMLTAAARDEAHLAVIQQIGFHSVLIVPIIARDRTLGAITFVATKESNRNYTEEDLTLAEGLAARAALAIDNARLYEAAQKELNERRRVQDALYRSEERFRFALANSDIAVYTMDRDLRYTWVYNGKYSGENHQLYGKTDADFLEPTDAALLTAIKRRVLETGVEERQTVRATMIGGPDRFYDTLFAPLQDSAGNIIGITGTVNEVTERKRAQDALALHQAEIESLNVRLQRSMRETHHRVKNNLQVITALVNLQEIQYDQSIPVSEMTRLNQHIRSLAAIHDLLTHQAQTDAEVSEISLKEIMDKLIPSLQAMVGERTISFQVEDLRLPVRLSSTFAVLVNELTSNALKHGAGNIHVSFHVEKGNALLEVTDEGPGFPPDFDPGLAANTGLDLIDSLSRVDLAGSVRYENRGEGGGRVLITFPIPLLMKTPGEE